MSDPDFMVFVKAFLAMQAFVMFYILFASFFA